MFEGYTTKCEKEGGMFKKIQGYDWLRKRHSSHSKEGKCLQSGQLRAAMLEERPFWGEGWVGCEGEVRVRGERLCWDKVQNWGFASRSCGKRGWGKDNAGYTTVWFAVQFFGGLAVVEMAGEIMECMMLEVRGISSASRTTPAVCSALAT